MARRANRRILELPEALTPFPQRHCGSNQYSMGVLCMSSSKDKLAPAYQPTPEELPVLSRAANRICDEIVPRIKVIDVDGKQQFRIDHQDPAIGKMLIAEDLGGVGEDVVNATLMQLVRLATRNGRIDETRLNAMLAVIRGLRPRDHLELMVATGMTAIHAAGMDAAVQLGNSESPQQQDAASRRLNTLTRTFTAQMEALGRHRAGSERSVTVEKVTVNEGGQAIVGNVGQPDRSK